MTTLKANLIVVAIILLIYLYGGYIAYPEMIFAPKQKDDYPQYMSATNELRRGEL